MDELSLVVRDDSRHYRERVEARPTERITGIIFDAKLPLWQFSRNNQLIDIYIVLYTGLNNTRDQAGILVFTLDAILVEEMCANNHKMILRPRSLSKVFHHQVVCRLGQDSVRILAVYDITPD